MKNSLFRQSRLLFRHLESHSHQETQQDEEKPRTADDFDALLKKLQDETEKQENTQKAEDFRKRLEEMKRELEQSTTREFELNKIGRRQNVYLHFDKYVNATCVGPNCLRIAGPDYTITRSRDGTVKVDSKIPFSYKVDNGNWAKYTPGDLRVAKQENVESPEKEEGASVLQSLPSPRRGWKAYEVAVPTGKAFSARIGNYTNPIRIAANTVSYGSPRGSIGFYIRREKGTNGTDRIVVESNKNVSDAKIEQ